MTVDRKDPEALRAEIRRTRAELGDTAAALSARADVKARVRQSAARTSDRVKERATRVRVAAVETAEQARIRLFDGAGRMPVPVRDSDLPAVARRPMPAAAVLAVIGVAVVAVAAIRWRRR